MNSTLPLTLKNTGKNLYLFYTKNPKCFMSNNAFDHNACFRAKVIPQDIWVEKKDPRYTEVEEVQGRWHYVERLFPKLRIPELTKEASPTGWKAPSKTVPDFPYFIGRTRNHMLPVYEKHVYKDRVRVTQVRKVQGDIWVFEQDLKNYLQEKLGTEIESHVNEICCWVNVKGQHENIIKNWLYEKGF